MSDTERIEDTELADYIGGYWYNRAERPRWKTLKDIRMSEDGELTFVTSPCNAESVPRDIREEAYDRYDGGNLLLRPDPSGTDTDRSEGEL